MKLAASQLAWNPANEQEALQLLQSAGFAGIEILPGRVAGEDPYESPAEAALFAATLQEAHGLSLCSMQSIWFGQAGSMFGADRPFLLDYTKKAVLFAGAAHVPNMVFGCPKNRVLPEGKRDESAVTFFREIGDLAAQHGTCLALEANPPLYGTNFMNRTADAFAMAKRVSSPGCKVNFDFGTTIENSEDLQQLCGHVGELSHVHISEPNLLPIEQRPGHRQLADILRDEGYTGFVSIEMKDAGLDTLARVADYVAEVFA